MIFLLIKNNFSTERKAQMTVDCRLHLISMQCLIVSNCTKMNIQINQSFTIVCLPDHGVHKKKNNNKLTAVATHSALPVYMAGRIQVQEAAQISHFYQVS